jgi:hypothetical protein
MRRSASSASRSAPGANGAARFWNSGS